LSAGINDSLSEVNLGNLDELVLDKIWVSAIQTVLGVDMEISPHAGVQPSADIILGLVEGEENHANIVDLPREDVTTTNDLNCGEAPNEEWLNGEGNARENPEPWNVQTEVIH
jgi:hypothetical protein